MSKSSNYFEKSGSTVCIGDRFYWVNIDFQCGY